MPKLALGLSLPSRALLGKAGNSGPAAPVLAMDPSWNTAQASPIFDIDAVWADQDDLQFERQAAGGDWSGATVTHHTVVISEINGTQISLGIGTLSNGSYEARCKFKHSGGSYSVYSNTQSFTIAASVTNRLMWSTSQQLWSTDHLTWA